MSFQTFDRRKFATAALPVGALMLSGCALIPERSAPIGARTAGLESGRTLARPDYHTIYAGYPGERFPISSVAHRNIDSRFLRQTVEFEQGIPQGSIVVDPDACHLYFVESKGVATRYGVGVGREGFAWSGGAQIKLHKNDQPGYCPSLYARRAWRVGLGAAVTKPLIEPLGRSMLSEIDARGADVQDGLRPRSTANHPARLISRTGQSVFRAGAVAD